MAVGYEIFLFKLVIKLGDVVIWGARRLQEFMVGFKFSKVFAGFIRKGCPFSREVMSNFSVNFPWRWSPHDLLRVSG